MKPQVLLIEDNLANRQLATFLLEHVGAEVLNATNGREGLAQMQRGLPALVVLDIQMPEMDGYEVAAAIKANPAWCKVPIFVVSSYAMPGDRARAMKLGVENYLEKPYDPEEFLRRVRPLLGLPAQP